MKIDISEKFVNNKNQGKKKPVASYNCHVRKCKMN